MSSPKVVPILFPGDPYDAQVRDFFTKLPGSSYWTETVSEYGVGPVTVLPPYVPTFAASEDTPAWLTAFLANPPAGVPAPDDNTIYAIVYPPGWGADEGACVYFGADHYFTSMPSGQNVVFTENPICPNGYIGLSGLDNATFGLSHEITESVTDPLAQTYIAVNWALSGWASADEGSAYAEVADLCEFQPNAAYLDPGIGHVVTRIWSNASIAAGHDPCHPLLPNRPVYFNTEVVLTDGTQTFPYGYTKGLSIRPGQEVTVPVRLQADGPMQAWTLAAAEESNPHLNPDIYNELSFSWDSTEGRWGTFGTSPSDARRPPMAAPPRSSCASESRQPPGRRSMNRGSSSERNNGGPHEEQDPEQPYRPLEEDDDDMEQARARRDVRRDRDRGLCERERASHAHRCALAAGRAPLARPRLREPRERPGARDASGRPYPLRGRPAGKRDAAVLREARHELVLRIGPR